MFAIAEHLRRATLGVECRIAHEAVLPEARRWSDARVAISTATIRGI